MLGTILVKTSDPQKPIWTAVGPFRGPRPALQNLTTNSGREKQGHNRRTLTTQNPRLLSAERSFFGEKRGNFDFCFALGLLAFLLPKTCKDHNANKKNNKNKGFCCFFLRFLRSVYPKKDETTKQQTTTTIKTKTRIKQNKKKSKKNRQHQTNKKASLKGRFVCFWCYFFFGSCCCPNNQNKTTKPQYHKTANKQQKQQRKIKIKQKQEEQPNFWPFFSLFI